jgi:hypothetical protein
MSSDLINKKNTFQTVASPLEISLPTGKLKISVTRFSWPIDDLCAFASRINQARGYLVISKVLGKHYPVKPKVMTRVYEDLASSLKKLNLESPLVMIGMAETATGLGRGVFESFGQGPEGLKESLFLQTTRYRLSQKVSFNIDESHCHAREHLVYEPVSTMDKEVFKSGRTLVLVDDEITTGQTLLKLSEAYGQKAKYFKRVVLVALTTWLSNQAKKDLSLLFPVPVDFVSLLEGTISFESYGFYLPPNHYKSVGEGSLKDKYLTKNFGRLGVRPGQGLSEIRKLTKGLGLVKERTVLVLGTGEFTYPPYLLAKYLEENGYQVEFQSTTRTPIYKGGVIMEVLNFVDNYYDGIDNFLYNVSKENEKQIVLCYETSPLPPEHHLPTILSSRTVFF